MNIPPWSPDALLRSRDFETAGRQLLEAMFAVLRDALAGDAELLRGFVHL